MQIRNIHERVINATTLQVGSLINSLASEHDLFWPKTMWPPMRFDRPLGVKASGGHGPISYEVVEFIPGKKVLFRFTSPPGFCGHHWFDVIPHGDNTTILRHTISMKIRGTALLSWPLIIRPLHDALIEDALALAQASVGVAPSVSPWSAWVKLLRWIMSRGKSRSQQTPKIREVTDPPWSSISGNILLSDDMIYQGDNTAH